MKISELDIARACSLRIYEPSPSFVNANIEVCEDKIVSTERIESGALILSCYPLLSYSCFEQEGNVGLLCALKTVSASDIRKLLERIACLYPRTEADIRLCMRRYSPHSDCDNLLASSLNIVHLKCHHNEIRTDSIRYLYSEASKLNHSCSPNCEWVVGQDNSLSVMATRKISPREELTISYVQASKVDAKTRREKLLSFGFYCKCELCITRCHTCNVSQTNTMLCGACRTVIYCSVQCQKEDWTKHKCYCLSLR